MSVDRRPIASREHTWSKSAAHFLAVRGSTPNGISIAGMVCGVLAGLALASTQFAPLQIAGFLCAAVFIQLRLLANMFDGMVAIETKKTSAVGELYNEIPDRVSDTATLVGAGYAVGGIPELGYWATILALIIAYIRAQGKVAGAPQEYCGPMAKQDRMFVIFMASIVAAFIPHRLLATSNWFSEAGVMSLALAIVVIGELITVFRRLSRISSALRSSST